MNDTKAFNLHFSNYKYLINTIAKSKGCRKQPDSLASYEEDYIQLTGLTRDRKWRAPSNSYLFKEDCIKDMKAAQDRFEQKTNGIKFMLISFQMIKTTEKWKLKMK